MSSVSVVIPSYNYARFLRGCVESVLMQKDVEVEVLIIDDCSSDDTDAVGQELAADPRVTYWRHKVNKGHIATYNEGLEWASADYLALISADDLLTPGALKRATTALDSRSTAGFAYGRSVYFVDNDAIPPAVPANHCRASGRAETGSLNAVRYPLIASRHQRWWSGRRCSENSAVTEPIFPRAGTSRCGCASPLMLM